MAQRRGGLDLLHEALGAEHGGELGLEDLDRDLAIVLEVFGQIHGGHAALPERALDAVAVGQGGDQAVGSTRHLFASSTACSMCVSQWGMTRR